MQAIIFFFLFICFRGYSSLFLCVVPFKEQSIHDVVVRGRIDDNDIEMFQKHGYDLTDSDGLIIRPSKSYETATTLSTAQRTLTGSALGIMQRFDVRSELER